MSNIYGVVTLYNPDLEEAARNINRYLNDIGKLLIWANSPVEDRDKFLDQLTDRSKVEFVQSDKNAGVVKALNAALRRARAGGYEYLLSMDQDSTWNDFGDYLEKAMTVRANDESVTITGPYAVETEEEAMSAPGGVMYLDYVIFSGALYDISMFDKTGDFAEVYFIDAADEEFCLRAGTYGFRHAVIGDSMLVHRFGERIEHKILGIKIVTHNYSPLRYYYSVRNHIWLIRSGYSPASRSFRLFGRYVIKTFIRALFFETDRKDKVSAVFRGIRDGYSNAQRNEWRRC
ncbi:MAG: hypothetical protein IKQ81_06590 [Clostridiales bacterium]|nr:hypothetical protein [Clostridiales bacterium]